MGKIKYLTEEERKEARRRQYHQYYLNNKEKRLEYKKQYYQDNKEHIKQYREDNKEHTKEYHKQYYQDNKEAILEKGKKWRDDNREFFKQWRKTPVGRANKLLSSYKKRDDSNNRGECTLTPEWIIDNIFSKPCHYCGESDWTKIGCDRIDNDKPHTPDNVVPCCYECNVKRHLKDYEEFKKEMGMT